MLVKYTMLGLYAGLMLMMAGAFLGKRDIKGLFKGCGGFLAGMLLPVIPWLIYFGWKKGLSAWYECYIYNNIFFYSNFEQEALGIGQRIYELCKLLLWLFVDNPFFFGLILIGMVFLLVSKQFRWFEKLNIIVMAGLLFLGIYVGGSNLPYYAIPLTVFAVTGLLPFGRLLDRISTGEGKRLPYAMTTVCVVLCMGLSYRLSMNTPFMQQSRGVFSFQVSEDRRRGRKSHTVKHWLSGCRTLYGSRYYSKLPFLSDQRDRTSRNVPGTGSLYGGRKDQVCAVSGMTGE